MKKNNKNIKCILKNVQLSLHENKLIDRKVNEMVIVAKDLDTFKMNLLDYCDVNNLKLNSWDSNCNFQIRNGITTLNFEIVTNETCLYDEIYDWINTELYMIGDV